jgi:hypothetical protein
MEFGPILATVVTSFVAAPLISALSRWFGRQESRIEVRMPSGKSVTLDLNGNVSSSQASQVIEAAVRSLKSNDSAGLRDVVATSHALSEQARGSVRPASAAPVEYDISPL